MSRIIRAPSDQTLSWQISRLHHRMWKIAIMSCISGFREVSWRKGTKIIAWFTWKWLKPLPIKWFKSSKWWKLHGLPLSWLMVFNLKDGHNDYKRWFACFVAKNVKDRSFVVFWKCQGKALKFFVCIVYIECRVERIYRLVVKKAKNEVGNHPSHDATLTANLYVAKT